LLGGDFRNGGEEGEGRWWLKKAVYKEDNRVVTFLPAKRIHIRQKNTRKKREDDA